MRIIGCDLDARQQNAGDAHSVLLNRYGHALL